MDKVSFGIPVPVSGGQSHHWWAPLVKNVSTFAENGIQLVDVIPVSSMMVDVNRNKVVETFLKSDAEWLRWLDADNVDPVGSIRWQLDAKKALITGLYIKRNKEGEPVAYVKTENGYDNVRSYNPGEIFPIAAAGLGGCLVHRSVFEEIEKNYRMFSVGTDGGVLVAHKDDILGDVFDDAVEETDGKVVNGVLQQRVYKLQSDRTFAHFQLMHGRSEDYSFFEHARRVGFELWLDTGLRIGHIGEKVFSVDEVFSDRAKQIKSDYYERIA